MKKLKIFGMAVSSVFLAVSALQPVPAEAASGADRILESYLFIQEKLAGDSLEGVQEQAKKIAAASAGLKDRELAGKIEQAAGKVAAAPDLAAARDGFVELSQPMVKWAQKNKPEGVRRAACPMRKNGEWLQRKGEIANPYFGKEMKRCGEFKG